ncbi:GEM-like protein 7 [Tanacetum coccineum]
MDTRLSNIVMGIPITSTRGLLLSKPYQPHYSLSTSKSSDMHLIKSNDGKSLIEIVKHKLSYGAKILPLGREGKIFRKNFCTTDNEKLVHASRCSLYTTAGAIEGILFMSTERVGFCSDRSLKTYSATGDKMLSGKSHCKSDIERTENLLAAHIIHISEYIDHQLHQDLSKKQTCELTEAHQTVTTIWITDSRNKLLEFHLSQQGDYCYLNLINQPHCTSTSSKITNHGSLGPKIIEIMKHNLSHSDRSIKTYSTTGEQLKFQYKVSIPLEKIKGVLESKNMKRPSSNYVELVTVDDFSFWFTGFISIKKTLRYLHQAADTGKVCILTNHLDIIRETVSIPVDNEHILVRVYEFDEDIDSLFNGYLCESSSDDDDDKSVNDDKENNLNTSGEDDELSGSDDESTQSRKDDEYNDDYRQVEDCGGKMKVDDLSGESSSVGANSKNLSGINPNTVRVSGFGDSKIHTGTHIEEGSMSYTCHGVNHTNKNSPMKDRESPYVTDKFSGDTEVKSTPFCSNSNPTFVHTKPNSLTGPLNYRNHISSSKAQMAQSLKPMPNRLASSRSPTRSRNKTNSRSQRSLSVPPNTLS